METNINLTPSKRLKKVIDWSQTTIHAFAMKIGMTRSENLYRILRNDKSVSVKIVKLVTTVYPQINHNWLLYGVGNMLKQTELEEATLIPYHETSDSTPTFNFYIPIIKNGDRAVIMDDKALEPIIPENTFVIIKQCATDSPIIFGKIYHIKTKDFNLIRVVRKSIKSNDELILKALNEKDYDDIVIQKQDILNIAMVLGSVNKL